MPMPKGAKGVKKVCTRCKEEKDIESFYKNPSCRDGHASHCKMCSKKSVGNSRKNPEKVEIWKEYGRRSTLSSRYGISAEIYDSMEKEQNGVCAICKVDGIGGRGKGTKLAVDHDHETGEVRGLLCVKCNSGLGHFNDSPELLAMAMSYLSKGIYG